MSPRIIRIALYILVPFILLSVSSGWLLEWLWIRELGYANIFWTLKGTQAALGIGAFVVAGLYLVLNFRFLADRLKSATFVGTPLQEMNVRWLIWEHHKRVKQVFTGAALLFAFFFALSFYMRWDESLRFLWNAPFGQADPLFGRDIGFYMFQLPFWELVQGSFHVLALLTTILLAAVYFLVGLFGYTGRGGLQARPEVMNHLKLNAALWLVLLAWGFYLDRFQLLFNPGGLIYGAGYTDVTVQLPALWILVVLVILLAVMMIASRWIRLGKLIPWTAGGAFAVLVLGRVIVPAMVQNFSVDPNELELERPYIEHNIQMTRLAYGLDDVTEIEYMADDTLTLSDIRQNQDAIDNIRLWDPRLLIQTYRQLQEIRSYYEFHSVDNDRYVVDGQVRQMMLSAREITPRLPRQSDTWVNRHLQFTHGYGVTMSPVTETNRQGEPILVVRDLPPVYESPDLRVENPAIYYGESSGGYYIVNSGTPELHYPDGDENVYTHYSGRGGIPISNWFRKLLFAWELGDINILLSDYIHPESRLQLWRGVQDRIRRVTPFLKLDRDPYLVVFDGRLYWIQDAYTTSGRFPYAQPSSDFNYIRNSVKIVVDAYHGTIDYYIVDENDPVLNVYASIFPNVFNSIDDVPAGLERHFRYPQDLFEIQLHVFSRYHMTRSQVFYNNEDLWTRPNEKYGGRQVLMEPYYVLARLPEEETLEFMLISPLTPANRDNMISWMSAKSDPDEYGRLLVYKLPKQRLYYGPSQIEARIDQDPVISQQLALWDQRGSRVIRGNLMVIPIGNSFIYVEPVFLLAEGVDIPQLQRVIVAIGDNISMQPTIEEAIVDLLGQAAQDLIAAEQARPIEFGDVLPEVVIQEVPSEELERARGLWRQLRRAFEAGDWTRYGELMKQLDDLMGG